jgi:C4-dicarboxylate transporter, DctM subunit
MSGLVIGTLVLAAVIMTGHPVAFALMLGGSVGLLMEMGVGPLGGVLQTTPYRTTAAFLLTTVPMFLLMASFMDSSRLAPDIYRSARQWVGHVRGGLAAATVFASAGFAALTGASIAASAAMAKIAVPEMRRQGYKETVALGAVACSGTLAIMIPPSIALIIYGMLAEQSIGRLLIAGIVPGVLTALLYMMVVWVWAWRRPLDLPRSSRAPVRERVRSLKPIWPGILIFGAVIGGIYSGAVTAAEAGAVGAFASFILVVALRRLSLRETLSETVHVTSMIFTIMIGAMIFGFLLSRSRMAHVALDAINRMGIPPFWVLMIIALLFIVLGMIIDPVAIQFLTIPTIVPLLAGLGYDPIWLGIVVVKLIEIGLITPPLGLNAYVTASSADVPVERVFGGVLPFIVADVLVIALVIAIPQIVLWLPGRMM